MKASIRIAFVFMVTVPLLLVSWFGWRSVVAEQERFERRLMDLQKGRLKAHTDGQARWLETLQTTLVQLLESIQERPYAEWPEAQGQNRFVLQFFAVGADGRLEWPNPLVLPLTEDEAQFRNFFEAGKIELSATAREDGTPVTHFQWSTWFEGPGQQWAFWIPGSENRRLGLVVDRVALLSEVILQMPDTVYRSSYRMESMDEPESFTLINETGQVLHHWGDLLNPEDAHSTVEAHLPKPLNMWRIQLASRVEGSTVWYRQPTMLVMILGIMGLLFITMGAALYVYRETRREFQQARQRVSFVNQVSHEFKTPLTNIQLYADLLEESVGGQDGLRYLHIIREESGKLSRMIQNVLTFARHQKSALRLHPVSIVPDQLVRDQLEILRPGLERRNISLTLDLNAGSPMELDAEVLSQVFCNLLSNAEKYAPESCVSIATSQKEKVLNVTVEDSGPGIAASRRESVFEPFVRLEDHIREGVSGTGIGLSISRELARLHGGDLVLVPTENGTRFVFQLMETP